MGDEHEATTAKSPVHLRLLNDYNHLKNHLDEDTSLPFRFSGDPASQRWSFVLFGPLGTDFEGGMYFGTMTFPDDFPFTQPTIHVHVTTGNMILDMPFVRQIYPLQDWLACTTVKDVLLELARKLFDDESFWNDSVEKRIYAKRNKMVCLRNDDFCQEFPDLMQEIEIKLIEAGTYAEEYTDYDRLTTERIASRTWLMQCRDGLFLDDPLWDESTEKTQLAYESSITALTCQPGTQSTDSASPNEDTKDGPSTAENAIS